MHFINRVMSMKYIDGTSHKSEKEQELFNQSYLAQIIPLVIYALRGGHTHTYLYESDFKKLGAFPSLKISKIDIYSNKTPTHNIF